MAQGSNTWTLRLQKLQRSFLCCRGPSGLIYFCPLDINPQLIDWFKIIFVISHLYLDSHLRGTTNPQSNFPSVQVRVTLSGYLFTSKLGENCMVLDLLSSYCVVAWICLSFRLDPRPGIRGYVFKSSRFPIVEFSMNLSKFQALSKALYTRVRFSNRSVFLFWTFQIDPLWIAFSWSCSSCTCKQEVKTWR